MYNVVINRIPRGAKRFEEPLYHQASHRKLQAPEGWRSYYLVNDRLNAVEASLHFLLKGNFAMSPARAPFGGMATARVVARKAVEHFFHCILADLKDRGIQKVKIRTEPQIVQHPSIQEKVLLDNGFECEFSESSSLIPVRSGWRKRFHRSEQKRLRKCELLHYRFDEFLPDDLKRVYSFINSCRTRKGYELSLRWSEIQKLKNKYPERIKCFGVWDGDKLIAAALTLVVSKVTLYDFYHDHDDAYDSMSPIVMLMDGMIGWSLESKFQRIDLGTSMLGDQINAGLHRFKLRLGALPAERKTWIKVLA